MKYLFLISLVNALVVVVSVLSVLAFLFFLTPPGWFVLYRYFKRGGGSSFPSASASIAPSPDPAGLDFGGWSGSLVRILRKKV